MDSLTDIIDAYQKKQLESPRDAALFALREFQGEYSHALNRRYLALFMIGEEGDGYDPINKTLYSVDPDAESLHFAPEDGQFVLFKRKGKRSNAGTVDLFQEGKKTWIQEVQVVGTNEVLNAHVYDPELDPTRALMDDFIVPMRAADAFAAEAASVRS